MTVFRPSGSHADNPPAMLATWGQPDRSTFWGRSVPALPWRLRWGVPPCIEWGSMSHRPKFPAPVLAISALVLILSAPGLAPPARAQGSDWSITFGSGFAKPEGGAFGAVWKRGTPIVLAMAGQMSAHFELGGEFGFVKFKPDRDSTLIPGVRGGDTDWEMWRIRLRARRFLVSPDAKLAPFVMAGVGIYPISAQSSDSTGTLKVTQTANGVSIGGGADFRAGDAVGFGLEGQYHYIRTNREVLGYKASPMLEVLFVIRWIPGGGSTGS